jgi:hypothetical protein
MKALTEAEKRDALKSLVDTDLPDLILADRSQLERWATCPWQAKAVDDGRCKTVGMAAEAGQAIHDALSSVTRDWIDSNGAHSPADLRNDLEFALRSARPDVQPDAIKGMMPSLWAWAKFIEGIHPGNILRFDGGEDVGRSGQLAWDIPDLGVRVTSELDLLYSSPSPEVVEEVDYKTGHKMHGVDDVAASFQFQLHALLVLNHYPEVNALSMRVWDTRANRLTYRVMFPRNRLHDYAYRVRSAVDVWRTHADNPPAWPALEKCQACPAASLCPVADEPLAQESPALLRQLIATEARADAIRQVLSARVDADGQDVVCGNVAFGRRKPKTERKAPATLYDLKGGKDE